MTVEVDVGYDLASEKVCDDAPLESPAAFVATAAE
jgi:hypothetical protein